MGRTLNCPVILLLVVNAFYADIIKLYSAEIRQRNAYIKGSGAITFRCACSSFHVTCVDYVIRSKFLTKHHRNRTCPIGFFFALKTKDLKATVRLTYHLLFFFVRKVESDCLSICIPAVSRDRRTSTNLHLFHF